jgi:hypothetical protein
MALQFRFSSSRMRAPEQEEFDDDILGSGFRFGSCLLCVTPSYRSALALPVLVVTERSSGASRILNVHTRFVPLEVEDDTSDANAGDQTAMGTPNLLAMLLEDHEEHSEFPDLSSRFVLQASIGARVVVRRHDMMMFGEIIDRERSRGNFRYLVALNNGQEYEGAPVFVGEDLIGVLVRAGPCVATVLGLEPVASRTSPASFFQQNRNRTSSVREAFQSLLPESRSRHDLMRDRLQHMRLLVEDHDFEMS